MSKIQWPNYRVSLILILVTFCGALSISQWCLSSTINSSVSRIDSVQQKLDAFYIKSDTIKASVQALAIQDARLELQKERLKVELEVKKQELFWYNIAFLGIGSVLGFLTLLFLIPKAIENQAKIEVDDKIGDAIRGRSQDVRDILSNYEQETFLINKKRIFIQGKNSSDNEKIKSILIENGINSANIFLNEDELKHGYEILFINNLSGKVLKKMPEFKDNILQNPEHEESKQWETIKDGIVALKHDVCIFYYNETRILFPTDGLEYDLKKRINFATNPAQIYGNLINSLKYQHRLSKA